MYDTAVRSEFSANFVLLIPKIFCSAQGFLVWNFEAGILDEPERPRCGLSGKALARSIHNSEYL
jgi:hypothetical protein